MRFRSLLLGCAIFIMISLSPTWHILKFDTVKNWIKNRFDASGGQSQNAFSIQYSQRYRQAVLGKACEELKLKKILPQSDSELEKLLKHTRLFYSDRYKLISCLIPKVGTTNFKKFFLAAENLTKEEDPRLVNQPRLHATADENLLLSTLNGSEARYRLNNYFKTVVVRDPAIRILSAFRDRIENKTNLGILKTISQQIHSEYNKPSTSFVSLPEFIRYIVNSHHKRDVHWRFYNTLCCPCTFKYDYILHLETLEDDWPEVKKKIGKEIYDLPQGRPSSITTDDDKLKRYFGNKIDLLRWFYNAYQIDYKLFGYSAPKLL